MNGAGKTTSIAKMAHAFKRDGATTILGARATVVTIRRNLKFSLVYNLAAGALAVTGLIHPLIGAIVMPLSSLTVLASSLRSRAFRAGPGRAPPLEPTP